MTILLVLTVLLLILGIRQMARGLSMGDDGLTTFLAVCVIAMLGVAGLLIAALKGLA